MYRAALIPSPRLPQKCLRGTHSGRGVTESPPRPAHKSLSLRRRVCPRLSSHHTCATRPLLSLARTSPAPPEAASGVSSLRRETQRRTPADTHTHTHRPRRAARALYLSLSSRVGAYYASATI